MGVKVRRLFTLKTKNPNAEVTVRDLRTGEITTIKQPLEK
jgi:hypothetical protein